MNRNRFLKSMGAAMALPVLAPLSASASPKRLEGSTGQRGNCTLIPTETAGPFPLDLTENAFFFRQIIHEDREGVQLRQRVHLGAEDCEPMANVRVNIWHCDQDSDYSGYAAMGSETYVLQGIPNDRRQWRV